MTIFLLPSYIACRTTISQDSKTNAALEMTNWFAWLVAYTSLNVLGY